MTRQEEALDYLEQRCRCEPYGMSVCVYCEMADSIRRAARRPPIPAPRKLTEWAVEIHRENVEAGWWPVGTARDRYVLATKIALIHSEVSEMLEGLRKGIPDDHLPHRTMEEVEAADIFIRFADYCGARGFDLDAIVAEKRAYNAQRADHTDAAREAGGGKKF